MRAAIFGVLGGAACFLLGRHVGVSPDQGIGFVVIGVALGILIYRETMRDA